MEKVLLLDFSSRSEGIPWVQGRPGSSWLIRVSLQLSVVIVEPKLWEMVDEGIYSRSNPVQVQSLNNIKSQAHGNTAHHSVCAAPGLI